jgi:hypothetical protein
MAEKVAFVEDAKVAGTYKYIICPDDKDNLLFIGVCAKSFGGHADIAAAFRNRQVNQEWLEADGRHELVDFIKHFSGLIGNPIGGGQYSIYDDVSRLHPENNHDADLELWGASESYGAVPQDILDSFKEPLKTYFKEKGKSIDVVIER